MSVFYERFERHAKGEGLKAMSTHYCPGCGHGLVHRYLADAIDDLGIQDRTVAISPVGCSVFLHYYLDVGNTQAAHGRAPAVALGHKLANPDAVVISYQGDGDLASIGLAEIIHAAQVGIPLTVIFVNNAVFGMTGGQMAPTTLMGQRTTTSPEGRSRLMGEPIKMAELISQLDGATYVERVALYDAKQRIKAQKAIRKALLLQAENRGFAFVEVLSECPLHLGRTPGEAERWVKEEMSRVFPLGVKMDAPATPWPAWKRPSFEPSEVGAVVGIGAQPAPRFCQGFPRRPYGPDIAFKLAGAGGDGAQTAAMLITRAAINEGFDATHIPSYGPESRGGTSYADVRVAEVEVLSPSAPSPHALVAFNAPSLARFGPTVVPGGVALYDRSVVASPPALDPRVRLLGVPCSALAQELGGVMAKNVVALGALHEATRLFPEETYLTAIRQALRHKAELLELDERAFLAGARAVRQMLDPLQGPACPQAQADGVPCPTAKNDCETCPDAHPTGGKA
ncbi:MAG TPA: 2-oxoacid:acceptor oxidoreductase family protein [Vicinamibacteria bacterium]|nr:2-oxoacid:acceptor oxidoreductase family protein [Vicinamibacteria bacterium]